VGSVRIRLSRTEVDELNRSQFTTGSQKHPLRGGISGPADCLLAGETIGLDAFPAFTDLWRRRTGFRMGE